MSASESTTGEASSKPSRSSTDADQMTPPRVQRRISRRLMLLPPSSSTLQKGPASLDKPGEARTPPQTRPIQRAVIDWYVSPVPMSLDPFDEQSAPGEIESLTIASTPRTSLSQRSTSAFEQCSPPRDLVPELKPCRGRNSKFFFDSIQTQTPTSSSVRQSRLLSETSLSPSAPSVHKRRRAERDAAYEEGKKMLASLSKPYTDKFAPESSEAAVSQAIPSDIAEKPSPGPMTSTPKPIRISGNPGQIPRDTLTTMEPDVKRRRNSLIMSPSLSPIRPALRTTAVPPRMPAPSMPAPSMPAQQPPRAQANLAQKSVAIPPPPPQRPTAAAVPAQNGITTSRPVATSSTRPVGNVPPRQAQVPMASRPIGSVHTAKPPATTHVSAPTRPLGVAATGAPQTAPSNPRPLAPPPNPRIGVTSAPPRPPLKPSLPQEVVNDPKKTTTAPSGGGTAKAQTKENDAEYDSFDDSFYDFF